MSLSNQFKSFIVLQGNRCKKCVTYTRAKIDKYFKIYFRDGRSTRQLIGKPNDVLIIGPGEMNIPNDGWGAVEFLKSKQQSNLQELNVAVGILNSWFHRDWIRAYVMRPKFFFVITIFSQKDVFITSSSFR